MADKFPLFEISADRDGDIHLGRKQTLRDLLEACRTAEEAGFPLDTELQHGYMNHLSDAVYVEKPTDWTRLSFDELQQMAISPNPHGKQAEAWTELRRRATSASGSA